MAIPAKYLLLSFLCFGIVDGNAKEPKPLAGTVPATSIQILENKGQIIDQFGKQRKDIDFKLENGGVTMYGGKGQLHYQWQKESQSSKVKTQKNSEVEIYRLDVTFVGSNPNAEVVFEEPTGYTENYYLPQCPDGATAKGYSKITYKNIYPNIDWVVYTKSKVKSQNPNENTSLVKYDFIVRPGGNTADIQLWYEGATDLNIVDGVLTATTPFGTITEDAPYSYNSETKKRVTSKYILNGNELRFDVGQYEGTLVIDPALLWATYFGNAGVEWLNAVDISVAGDLYVCGNADGGIHNIATTGAYQQVHGGDRDGVVAKYTTSGQKIWVTYYGGNKQDALLAIHTDNANNLFITGYAESSGLGSNGAHQAGYSGTASGVYKEDAILLKMNPNGQRIWATYYGDTLEDWGTSVVCDSFGYVYLAGRTISTRNIATPNRHKTTLITGVNYGNDGFIAKFDTSGNRQWGTYYGGFQTDEIFDIDAMGNGTICVTGRTNSDTGIATPGSHQPVLFHKIEWPKAGDNKAFVAKLDSSGNRLWGTYLGNDTLTGLGIGATVHFDESGNIYAGGTTADTSGIASMGAHQQTKNSINTTGFILKLNPNGIRQWGSYYGGEKQTNITDITTGIQDAVYVYGSTDDTTGISTIGVVQTKHKGGYSDMFIARLNTTGQRAWGSYYGGTSQELGGISSIWGTVVYQKHKVFFNFRTSSTGLATPGADKDTLSGGDGMLVCMYADTIVYIKEPFTDTLHCAGDTLKLPYDISYHFRNGNVFTVQLSDSTGNFNSPVNIGSRTDTLADTIVCVIPRNTPSGQQYRLRINASAPGFISEINTYPLRIKPSPTVIAANNGPICAGDTLKLFSTGTSTNVSYNWSGPASFTSSIQNPYRAGMSATDSGDYILKVTMNGCYDYDTTRASVKPRPATPAPTSNSPVCRGTALNLSATSTTTGVKFSWSGPNSFTDTAQNPTVNNVNNNHAGVYNVYTTLNGCTSATAGTTVAVGILTPAPVPSANSPLCARQDLQLTATNITGAAYNWYGPAGFTAGTQNPVRNYVQMNHAGKYYVYATINGCISDTDSVTVVVNTDPIVNIFPTPGTTICPGQQATFTAIPTNGGTAPSYQWRVNGIATVGTAVTYNSSTINNGDIVTCHMTSTTTCSTPFTDTSNAITMTVLPKMTPSVTISANPNTSLHPNEPINFTATPSQAGTIPTYQWRRNGKNIGGATSDTWGANANALGDGDEICVLLKSSYQCPDPDTVLSNCIKLDIRLGIVGQATNNGGVKVYPNPVNDLLHITLPTSLKGGDSYLVELYDIVGKKLFSQNGNATTMTIDMQKFAAGVYIIKVNDSFVERVVKE